MKHVELLSPVGSFQALVAAVNNGANAVYLGTKLFNARRLANNFTKDKLKTAIQYAHLHNVRVYITLNTLIKNHEIKPFLNQISIIESLGADAIILQDLSFAPLIKKHFPKLEVHASTQATLMNTPSIEYFKEFVDVFVLARELTKEEIKAIQDKTKVKLEIFVHGHLCISYSGQCLISSLIGSRSGNRGMCASSCRKQYNGDDYLLSAKDLSLISNVKEVIESGAHTLKIEGRMKSPEYVATTTREYRKQIDAYNAKKDLSVKKEQIEDLKLAFNREFTSGYFAGNEKIVDKNLSSKRGIYLGQVKNGYLKLNEPLEAFDGVTCVYKGERQGDFVKKIDDKHNITVTKASKGQEVKLQVPGFKNGAKIYLLSKHNGRNLLGQSKALPLTITCNIKQAQIPEIIISVNNKTITKHLSEPAQVPQKHPLTKEKIQAAWKKYDSQLFFIKELTINTDESFFPISEITKLRAQLDQLLLDLLMPINKEKKEIVSPSFTSTLSEEKKLHVKVYTLKALKEALRAGVDVIYYPLYNKDAKQARELAKKSALFYLETPMVIKDDHLQEMKRTIKEINPDGLLINNLALINYPLAKALGYQFNIFNDNQLAFYNHPAIASIELSAKELKEFKQKQDLIYYAHGRPTVMTFNEKIAKERLTDKKGYTFPLKHEPTQTLMLHSKTIATLQHTKKILDAGINQFFLDLEHNVFETIQAYRALMQGKRIGLKHLQRGVTVGNIEKGVM